MMNQRSTGMLTKALAMVGAATLIGAACIMKKGKGGSNMLSRMTDAISGNGSSSGSSMMRGGAGASSHNSRM